MRTDFTVVHCLLAHSHSHSMAYPKCPVWDLLIQHVPNVIADIIHEFDSHSLVSVSMLIPTKNPFRISLRYAPCAYVDCLCSNRIQVTCVRFGMRAALLDICLNERCTHNNITCRCGAFPPADTPRKNGRRANGTRWHCTRWQVCEASFHLSMLHICRLTCVSDYVHTRKFRGFSNTFVECDIPSMELLTPSGRVCITEDARVCGSRTGTLFIGENEKPMWRMGWICPGVWEGKPLWTPVFGPLFTAIKGNVYEEEKKEP